MCVKVAAVKYTSFVCQWHWLWSVTDETTIRCNYGLVARGSCDVIMAEPIRLETCRSGFAMVIIKLP